MSSGSVPFRVNVGAAHEEARPARHEFCSSANPFLLLHTDHGAAVLYRGVCRGDGRKGFVVLVPHQMGLI